MDVRLRAHFVFYYFFFRIVVSRVCFCFLLPWCFFFFVSWYFDYSALRGVLHCALGWFFIFIFVLLLSQLFSRRLLILFPQTSTSRSFIIMMQTITMVTIWQRLLFACFLCTLWAAGGSSDEATEVLNKAREAEELGDRAASVQTAFLMSVEDPLKFLEEALKKTRDANVNEAVKAVERVKSETRTLNGMSYKVRTPVKDAVEVALKVVDEANKLTRENTNAEGMKEEGAALKRAAQAAAKSWKTAAENAETQVTNIENILEAVEKTKTDLETKVSSSQKEDMNNALKRVTTSLENLINKANELKALAQTTEEEIKKAITASKETVKEAKYLAKGSEADAQEKTGANKNGDVFEPPPQALPWGTENQTKNGYEGKTATETTNQDRLKENSSFDGHRLTVSHLATTFVLLFLARVVVMVSA